MNKKNTLAVALVFFALLSIAFSCTPETKSPDIQPPDITIHGSGTPIAPSTPSTLTTTPQKTPASSTDILTTFPFIEYGQGEVFLKQPLFFSSWTQDWNFYRQIPEINSAWDAALPEDVAGQLWFTGYLNQFLERGQHYLGAGMTPMHEPGENYTPKPQFAALDIDGNPIPVTKPGMGNYLSNQYWMNLLNPGWQDLLIDRAKAMIDMGVEGVVIDESTFNKVVIYERGGSFDEYSMNGFREYLQAKYSPEVLKSKLGILNIDSFNLKEYILSKNLEDTWNKSENPPLPITYEFGMFQQVESARFWRRMAAQTKQYAKDKYGREFFFSFSAAPEFITHQMPSDYIDYLTGEHFYFQSGWSVPKSSVVLKMSEGLAPKMAILVEVSHDLGTIPQQTNDLFKYVFADIYSADGMMMVDGDSFKTMLGWDYLDDNKIQYAVDEAARYVAFANAHPELYGLDEPAQVGVINSLASRRHWLNPYVEPGVFNETGIKGVVEILLNHNIPTDMLVSGDGELLTNTFTLADLTQYQVVIAPYAAMLSDEEATALLDYVKNGGAVIAIRPCGTHDKSGKAVRRTELETLYGAGEYTLGAGNWYTINEDIGFQYAYNEAQQRMYLPTERTRTDAPFSAFSDALLRYHEPEIVTDSPLTVNIRRYVDDTRIVLHMANYDYAHQRDTIAPAGPFTITVSLPEGCTPETAILYDFEGAQQTEVALTIQDKKATLTIPSLYAYSVLEIR